MSEVPVRRIAIIGSGAVAWLSALSLARGLALLRPEITVVEMADVDDGLLPAENALPSIRALHRRLGIEEAELMASGASLKLGTRYHGFADAPWTNAYGAPGGALEGVSPHKLWLRLYREGASFPLTDLSLGATAASAGRYAPGAADALEGLGWITHGYHIDSRPYTDLLRQKAAAAGVRAAVAAPTALERGPTGTPLAVRLADGRRLEAQLWLDCTGPTRTLADRASPKSDGLDRAASVRVARKGPPSLVAEVHAEPLGLRTKTPLAEADVFTLVYASAAVSDDEAAALLVGRFGAECGAPRIQPCPTAGAAPAWRDGVVAVGAAAAGLAPLEGVAFQLVHSVLAKLISVFPATADGPWEAAHVTRWMESETARARDFVDLHLSAASARHPTPAWAGERVRATSAALRDKIGLFEASGRVQSLDDETFAEPAWAAAFIGLGLRPRADDALAAAQELDRVAQALDAVRRGVAAHVARYPIYRTGGADG